MASKTEVQSAFVALSIIQQGLLFSATGNVYLAGWPPRILHRLFGQLMNGLAATLNCQAQLKRDDSLARVRVGVQNQRPVIWKDSVITDHRPRRGENADGTRKHLDIAQLGTDGSSASSAATAS